MAKISQKRGQCVFCGAFFTGGLSSGTREHIFSDWLADILPKTHTSHTQAITKINHQNDQAFDVISNFIPHNGDELSRKLKIVCKNCNNGWMSRLETEVRGALTDLIKVNHITLTPNIQKVLATWIAVKTAVSEYTDLSTKTISEQDKKFLKDHMVPPASWKIWIGSYEGLDWNKRFMHHGYALYTLNSDFGKICLIPNTQVTAWGIGKVFFYVFSSSNKSCIPNFDSSLLKQIWPPISESITWPPELTFSDYEAHDMAMNAGLKMTFSYIMPIEISQP